MEWSDLIFRASKNMESQCPSTIRTFMPCRLLLCSRKERFVGRAHLGVPVGCPLHTLRESMVFYSPFSQQHHYSVVLTVKAHYQQKSTATERNYVVVREEELLCELLWVEGALLDFTSSAYYFEIEVASLLPLADATLFCSLLSICGASHLWSTGFLVLHYWEFWTKKRKFVQYAHIHFF